MDALLLPSWPVLPFQWSALGGRSFLAFIVRLMYRPFLPLRLLHLLLLLFLSLPPQLLLTIHTVSLPSSSPSSSSSALDSQFQFISTSESGGLLPGGGVFFFHDFFPSCLKLVHCGSFLVCFSFSLRFLRFVFLCV